MSKVKREDIKKMILNEMRMLGMGNMDMLNVPQRDTGCDACGMSPCQCDEYDDAPELDAPDLDGSKTSAVATVSREDCCAAIICLIECCSCPTTRQEIERCCSELLAGKYDR